MVSFSLPRMHTLALLSLTDRAARPPDDKSSAEAAAEPEVDRLKGTNVSYLSRRITPLVIMMA